MGNGFKETSFLKVDQKKYEENYDKIFNKTKEEPMIKFKPMTTNKKVIQAIKDTERIFDPNTIIGKKFYTRLCEDVEGYDLSDISPEYLMEFLINSPFYVTVKTYYPKWIFTKAHARVWTHKRGIELNRRRLKYKTNASIVGTTTHEFFHEADKDTKYKLGHGISNSPVGKENTLPYLAGRIAKELIMEEEFIKKNKEQLEMNLKDNEL